MLRVGLTGGIACGKSTVAAMMSMLGCHVLEADTLAHDLIEPGQPAYDEVVREFGAAILADDKRVDRAALARIVFTEPSRLEVLNKIVHPRVLEVTDKEFERIGRDDPSGIAVLAAALLIEAAYDAHLDRLVVVWCRPEQQIIRLTDHASGRGMTRAEAEQRIAAQMPLDRKKAMADDLVDASGTLDATRRQVTALVNRLKLVASQGISAAGERKSS
ncbi:MAG: dephospho-CoA kinase [Candidatus Acidiferrales bacterium]